MPNILHVFRHGLGDSVQFTSVLSHLAEAHPDWVQDVATSKGKHSAFAGLANRVFVDQEPDHGGYDRVFRHDWPECYYGYGDSPSTKTARCLRERFDLPPSWDRLRYTIRVGDEARGRAQLYLDSLPSGRKVAIHYEGNTSKGNKDLDHGTVRRVCDFLTASGLVPIILDWDRRSPLPDGKAVFCPDAADSLWLGYGTGDAETLAALLAGCSLFIGIDSGPQKVAFAVGVPTVAVWTGHHPIHYADNAPHAVHLVPAAHEGMMRGDRASPASYFAKHYQSVVYRDLGPDLCNQAAKMLGLNPMARAGGGLLKASGYTDDYYHEHRAAGLDYLDYGDWQRAYGRWLVDSTGAKGKTILDAGCACGSIAAGLAEAGGLVSGCDLSQLMIDLGRERWPGFPLFVCDCVNLHLWGDDTFSFVHSAQAFEHFKPELVPFILRELLRVTKPGGVLFAALDTEELFERQGRLGSTEEDPTHVCIRPLAWWYERAVEAGWRLDHDLLAATKAHPMSFFASYDWDAFTCRKPG